MEEEIKINDTLKFLVTGDLDRYRVESIFVKEPETIAWIDNWTKKSGEKTFIDIGANIGIYSLYAASKSPATHVFAFEPVSNNFISLVKNNIVNGFSNVTAFNVALSNRELLSSIYLSDSRLGNSGAQIDKPVNEYGSEFNPVKVEKVFSFSYDYLVSKFDFPVPNFLKIDVDGHEEDILIGMEKTLQDSRLYSLLIEFNENSQYIRWTDTFKSFGLEEDFSLNDLPNHSKNRRIEKGTVARNYIFTRR